MARSMITISGMDAEMIRQLIRLRLQDGRLPHEHAVELASGPGSGQMCHGCGASITRRQGMTLRLDTEDWSEITFHDEYFGIWDDERLKDPQLGRAAQAPVKSDRVASPPR